MLRVFRRRRFSLMLALLAAVLAWWLARGPEDLLFSPRPLLRHEPDYFLDDFNLVVAADDGTPRYRMSGVSMTHYPDTNTALLEQPRLEIVAADGGRWIVAARQAQAENNGAFVHLQGDVSISRDEASGLVLNTEALDVNVDEEYAVTDEAVAIRQKFGITRAQGMRINFRQRHLYLKSRVRGEYAPPAE
jgi:lipopolysaccharide export system protein LptC